MHIPKKKIYKEKIYNITIMIKNLENNIILRSNVFIDSRNLIEYKNKQYILDIIKNKPNKYGKFVPEGFIRGLKKSFYIKKDENIKIKSYQLYQIENKFLKQKLSKIVQKKIPIKINFEGL